jgi:hypothetical protein
MGFSIRVDPASWQEYIAGPRKGKALLLPVRPETGSPERPVIG